MKAVTRKRKQQIFTTLLTLILFIGLIIQQQVRGFMLPDFYDLPTVAPTWGDAPMQWLANNPQINRFKETGMAFNSSSYYANKGWPLGAVMYLQARDGYENPEEFKKFEGRHTYCTGNHQSAVQITPGARVFCSGKYQIGKELFADAVKDKLNPEFNFLLLAIACDYPGDYKVPDNTWSSYEDPEAASDAVVQLIAWMATDQSSDGFIGESFEQDFQTFKKTYYDLLMTAFVEQPEMDNWLKAEPEPSPQVTQYGLANRADEMFYDIWCATVFTAQLTPDWDSQIATFTTPMNQEDGEYVAEIEIPNEPGILNYMTGIKFDAYGDWKQTESLKENTLRFTSASGELDSYGAIGHLYWPEGCVRGLMPVDPTKAYLYTFDTFNLNGDLYPTGAFERTQTQFASYIEQGLNIYVTIGVKEPEPGESRYEVVRRRHSENWDSTYTVGLYKLDAETGKPIEGSRWDILERFDDTQLTNTNLDRTPGNPGSYEGSLGSLKATPWGQDTVEENYEGEMGVTVSDTNRYNWGNDKGSQFTRWEDPHEDPCKRDENVTGEDGRLYEINSSGKITTDAAHTDVYAYKYEKGYCDGHPAPVFEYVECDHEEGDCDCEELNQEIHEDGWNAWYQEVVTCEQLVKEGGFFHCIATDGSAKAALEEDRDEFYKDFISLTYEYSAEEIRAAKGYILHGIHTDDIPLEWRVVTSSEYKETKEAEELEHQNLSGGKEGKSEEEQSLGANFKRTLDKGLEEIQIINKVKTENQAAGERETLSHQPNPLPTATESNTTFFPRLSKEKKKNTLVEKTYGAGEEGEESQRDKKKSQTQEEDGQTIEDLEIFQDRTRVATSSVATGSDAVPKTEKTSTGFTKKILQKTPQLFGNPAKGEEREEDAPDQGNGLRSRLVLLSSLANGIKKPNQGQIDWTFVVYDHRTEGEIHFNKRDFNLYNGENSRFDAYGQENGDGTLDGAVYGLFAAEDIYHPDTSSRTANEFDTGVVFQEGDLVAMATTDRNGDGSFLVITEAPGTRYDYDAGKTIHTDWQDQAPKNLYQEEKESAAKEKDIERFIGHNPDGSKITAGNGQDLTDTSPGDGTHTEGSFWKYSSNQVYDSGMLSKNKVTNQTQDVYREEKTTGRSPLGDLESSNGNCWIGRPLLLSPDGSTYYIKELSRSEGYELSVFGKNPDLSTNRQAFSDGEVTVSKGSVQTTEVEAHVQKGEFTYTVQSSDTDQGYRVRLSHIPEGAQIHRTTRELVWDDQTAHPEEVVKRVPILAKEGDLVMVGGKTWKASLGDLISYNGKTFPVNQVQTISHSWQKVQPNNTERIVNPYLDFSSIPESGNVLKDINTLLSRLGYRKPVNGSPWVVIPVDSFTVEQVAKAVNERIFADPWYHVFNAFSVQDSFYANGHAYVAVSYCYRLTFTNEAVYNEENDKIYVKTEADYGALADGSKGFLYRVYDGADCEDVIKNGNGFVTSALVPNETAEGRAVYLKGNPYDSIQFVRRPDETLWCYGSGEALLDIHGEVATREEKDYVMVTPTQVEKITNVLVPEVRFIKEGEDGQGMAYGTYEYEISQEYLDSLEKGTVEFRVTFDGSREEAAIKTMEAGEKGVVSATLPLVLSGSYLESVVLTYPGQDTVMQDGGTITKPVRLQERPVRQKIKINKDIEVLPEPRIVWYCQNCGFENRDGEEGCGYCGHARTTEKTRTMRYAHDTYAAVHWENIPARKKGGWFGTTADWLSQLLTGQTEGETAESVPRFRFKAYLKSNLERLYRDEEGNVAWVDRNGNRMSPQYQDTNGDGNYDTFFWKYEKAYGEKEVDFPEKDRIGGEGDLESSNVQKIFTQVRHKEDSMTVSARANDVWSNYETPQEGARENVGEKEGFTTSEREREEGGSGGVDGIAVYASAALYSYQGKNDNVARSDQIRESQNTGYTRILEMTRTTKRDAAGNTRNIETYNYEKFFDAIHAANTDLWDDDMHSTYHKTRDEKEPSMRNYPGQHWSETFYEKYQKDDADPDHSLPNTDGTDPDGTAGGDRDTSFKPFRWIREKVFGSREDYEKYPAEYHGGNTEVDSSTSEYARANAEASDAVRQFAVKWYLEDEAARLLINNGMGEDVAREGESLDYEEEIYDKALFSAIAKAYNYLKPFYENDLDTIYSIEWDSAPQGGRDQDYTTLSIDLEEEKGHYQISTYLPYGVYVVVEQKPERRDEKVNEWENRSYMVEKPKEVMVPGVYDGGQANESGDNYAPDYCFDYGMTTEEQAESSHYLIRFGEEWGHNNQQDEREYVIRGHNYHGDFEVYKYGLDIDRIQEWKTSGLKDPKYRGIQYGENEYRYAGWSLTQEELDPLKDCYDTAHRGKEGVSAIGEENGGNEQSAYLAIDKTHGMATANGEEYNGTALKDRYFYGGISEGAGRADNRLRRVKIQEDGSEKIVSEKGWEDQVVSVTGQLTAYEGEYAGMLVPWTLTEPAALDEYSLEDFTGYADVNERNSFFSIRLRVNKLDGETGEPILHDNAIFGLYAGSRYNSFEEIEEDAKGIEDEEERERFRKQFRPGDAKFYLEDTIIEGSREFLKGMKATNISPLPRRSGSRESGVGERCTGVVKKGTPICVESERIMLTDREGKRTGQMTVYTTIKDELLSGEEGEEGTYGNQNTGYFETPEPIGAGVYVLVEIKAPDGYARSNPVAYEVYADKTEYYVDGDMYQKVSAVRYKGTPSEDGR